MKWHVGQRVQNRPEFASVYEGTEWAEKMKLPRLGTVVEVPLAIQTHPEQRGTILIEWDSLTGPKADPAAWRKWMYSDFIEVAA